MVPVLFSSFLRTKDLVRGGPQEPSGSLFNEPLGNLGL